MPGGLIGGMSEPRHLPVVGVDNRAIGRMAAHHHFL